MSFEETEDRTGVRVTWNHVPKLRIQHHRNIVPLAALITPLNNKLPITCLDERFMVRCRQCKAFLNPFAGVAANQNDVWHCTFCLFGNRLEGVPTNALSPELAAVEYHTGRAAKIPPLFLFVVDLCFAAEDVDAFEALKESLTMLFALLPANAVVGLISFGKHVLLHNLSKPSHSYTFNGSKEYTLDNVSQVLYKAQPNAATGSLNASTLLFLQRVEMAEYNVGSILSSLVPNTFPHNLDRDRAMRATGCALNVAALVVQAVLGKTSAVGGHILTFVAGPTTYGPGKIVGVELKEPIRCHRDIEKARMALPTMNSVAKADALLFKLAKSYYDRVADMLIATGISCSVFVGCYDQMGLYEMDQMCSKTGGTVVLCDSFGTLMFRQTIAKFFKHEDEDPDAPLSMGFNATLECRTTKDLQVQGLVGNATGLPPRKDKHVEACISPQEVGEGNTNTWKLCLVNPQSTYAVYFDKLDSAQTGHAFVQFSFQYQHSDNSIRLRVVTIPLAVIADSDGPMLELGFDQEAALVALARTLIQKLYTYGANKKTLNFDYATLGTYLDKMLVDYCLRFAQFRKGDLALFRLSNNYAMLPQFIYHLQRLPFLRVFNNSPDESSFVRHTFMHEDVTNSLIMVQPSLLSYDVETYGVEDQDGNTLYEPEPVLLDSMSLGPTKILLLDTFFQILIYHGVTVAQWRKADYHKMEGYEHFKNFLEAPKHEAMEVLVDRFPLPRFIDCDEGGSQARFLMAKLNPSLNYASNPTNLYGGKTDVMTDDTSLQLFMDNIQRAIVLLK